MLIVLAYVGVHFAIYALLLRGRASLRKEKGIFVYHLSSAILVGLAATILAFLEPSAFGLSGVALVLSVHGIYSISFLELWSLAQGGYSLSVLASIVKAESVSAAPDFSALELIGQLKQDDRIVALGVPQAAARDFVLGHLRIQIAVLFKEVDGVFSDAAYKISRRAKPILFKDNWQRIFELDDIREQVKDITTP